MEAGRLKQIEEIYHAAMEIPFERREAFFDDSCGADEDLRREVLSLLSFEKTSDEFIDTPLESLAAEMFVGKDEPIDFTDQEIGHYKVVKLLGRGGMGAVYLAADTKLDRRGELTNSFSLLFSNCKSSVQTAFEQSFFSFLSALIQKNLF